MNWFKKVKQEDVIEKNEKKQQKRLELLKNNIILGEQRTQEILECDSVSAVNGNKLKVKLPINNLNRAEIIKEQPLTVEQWEQITKECTFIDENKNIRHYNAEEVEALKEIVPKDKKQEALQVFSIAQFAKEHEVNGLFCLGAGFGRAAKAVQMNEALALKKELESAISLEPSNVEENVNDSASNSLKTSKSDLEFYDDETSFFIKKEVNNKILPQADVKKQSKMLLPRSLIEHPSCISMQAQEIENDIQDNLKNGNVLMHLKERSETNLNDTNAKLPSAKDEFPELFYPQLYSSESPSVQSGCDGGEGFKVDDIENSVVVSSSARVLSIPSTAGAKEALPAKRKDNCKNNESSLTSNSNDSLMKPEKKGCENLIVDEGGKNNDESLSDEQFVFAQQALCSGGMLINIKISKNITPPKIKKKQD